MKIEDVEITHTDLRVGMGIGGWDIRHTLTHSPSGCAVVYETHGSRPSQHSARMSALALLEMLVEEMIK